MTIRLYDLETKDDGSVSVKTDLSPEDMLALLTIGFYACLEKGVMVKSLSHFFQEPAQTGPDGEAVDIPDFNDFLDGNTTKEEKEENKQ